MRTDEQLDQDWSLIKAAIKRAGAGGNYPGVNTCLACFDMVEAIFERLNVKGTDDKIALLVSMAYGHAADQDQKSPASPGTELN